MSSPRSASPGGLPDRRRAERGVVATLAVFAAAVLVAGVGSGGADLLASLARIDVGLMALLLGMALVSFTLRFLRWHLAARALGIRVPILVHAGFFLAGFSMTLTPGRVGEVLRLWLLRRYGGFRYEKTAPLLFVDRLSDVVAIAVIAALAALLIGKYLLLSVMALAGALALNLVFFAPRPFLWMTGAAYGLTRRAPRLFARVRVALRQMGRLSDRRVYAGVLALSLASWLTEGLAFHLLLGRLAADLSAAAAVLVFTLATLAGVVTMLPGGLAGAEFSMLGMLLALGVPGAAAVAATAVIRLVTLWFAVLVGFIALPFALRKAGR
ncbi:MAG: flippase-like domain-containing protein [Alphaproteobacteria bacterium]|nr:flippase-like domain-containing protein [Alphaproteobacteria bacterium]